jgi:hypothetical protein
MRLFLTKIKFTTSIWVLLFSTCFANNLTTEVSLKSIEDKKIEDFKYRQADSYSYEEDIDISPNKNEEDKNTYNMLLSYVDKDNFKDNATIQILNKITNSAYEYKVKINEKFIFDDLYIEVYKCWQAPLDQVPESKILINTYAASDNEKGKKHLFYGWLFASSPAASGLENPIYDITAIRCS